MVDVSGKEATARTAVATGVLRTTAEVVALLRATACPRATRWPPPASPGSWAPSGRPDLVPLCHPIALSGVTVDLEPGEAEVRIRATVRTTDRTGVEMEALTAVAVAGLTLHDMVKAVDPAAELDAVRVERKEGGKTGTWTRPGGPRMSGSTTARVITRVQPGRRRRLRRPQRPRDRRVAARAGLRLPGRRGGPGRRTGGRGAARRGRRRRRRGDHHRGHRHLAHRRHAGGHPGPARLRGARARRRDPRRRGAGRADGRALARPVGRRGPHAGGQPARVDRRRPRRADASSTACSTTPSTSSEEATTDDEDPTVRSCAAPPWAPSRSTSPSTPHWSTTRPPAPW